MMEWERQRSDELFQAPGYTAHAEFLTDSVPVGSATVDFPVTWYNPVSFSLKAGGKKVT